MSICHCNCIGREIELSVSVDTIKDIPINEFYYCGYRPVNFTNPEYIPINFDEAKEAYRGCEIV